MPKPTLNPCHITDNGREMKSMTTKGHRLAGITHDGSFPLGDEHHRTAILRHQSIVSQRRHIERCATSPSMIMLVSRASKDPPLAGSSFSNKTTPPHGSAQAILPGCWGLPAAKASGRLDVYTQVAGYRLLRQRPNLCRRWFWGEVPGFGAGWYESPLLCIRRARRRQKTPATSLHVRALASSTSWTLHVVSPGQSTTATGMEQIQLPERANPCLFCCLPWSALRSQHKNCCSHYQD